VVTPLFFWFPDDPQTYTQDSEFMFGSALLVAPVVEQGATSRTVYLPAGANWIDFYTDQTYAGGQQITAAAPLDRIPVYVREGSIVPGGPLVQYVDQPVAQLMTVDLYPGPDATFVLYEDDGNSFDYAAGGYLKTLISRTEQTPATTVALQRTEGTWVPPDRAWTLIFHGAAAAPSDVQVNGTAVNAVAAAAALNNVLLGWFYDSTANRLLIRMQDSPSPLQVTITH
jgi:alpha-glucosidase (family GH31 glycosyl hydrolase)